MATNPTHGMDCADCLSCCVERARRENTTFSFCERMCTAPSANEVTEFSIPRIRDSRVGHPFEEFVSASLPALQQISITLHHDENDTSYVPLDVNQWHITAVPDTKGLVSGKLAPMPLPKPSSLAYVNVTDDGRLILTVKHDISDKFPFVLRVSSSDAFATFYVTVSPIIAVPPQIQYFTHSLSTTSNSAYFNISYVPTGNKQFNNAVHDVNSVYIVALQVEMDQNFIAHYFPFPSLNIEQLSITADEIIISSPLILPSTAILIQARRLVFRANGYIDTTPAGFILKPALKAAGAVGVDGPTINVYTAEAVDFTQSQRASVPLPLFISNGGMGQDGGLGQQGNPGLNIPTFPGNGFCNGKIGFTDVTFWSYYDSHRGKCSHLEWHHANDEHGNRQCPGHGQDSAQAGRSGDGGKGGAVFLSFPLASTFISVVGGTPGQKGPAVPGGNPGTPRTARWVMCGAFEANNNDNWWYTPQSSCVGCPGCGGNPCATTLPGRDAPAGEQGITGVSGTFAIASDGTFLTSSLLRVISDYINALHYENSIDRMQELLDIYLPLLHNAESSSSPALDWTSVYVTLLETYQHRVHAGLDYYDHRWGYVPMYPLEISMTIFTEEVYSSIRLLYLAHYLRTLSGQELQAVTAMSSMISQLFIQIQTQAQQLSDLQVSLPRLQSVVNQLQFEENSMKDQIQRVEKYLNELARDNVKRRHEVPAWKRALKFAAAVLPLIPIGQPELASIGGFAVNTLESALDVSNGDESLDSLITSIPTSYDTYKKAVGDDTLSKSVNGVVDTLKTIDFGSKDSYTKTLPEMYSKIKGIGSTVRGLTDLLKQNSVSKDEVQREFEQLEANDPELQDMKQKLIDLVNLKASAWQAVQETVQQISTLPTQIAQGIQNIDDMNHKITTTGNYVQDTTVMSLLETWLAGAEQRLQYWQYIVARAYEYRLAQPFPTSSSIQLVRDQILLKLSEKKDGPILNQDEVDTIAIPYTQSLRHVMQDVGKWLNQDKRKKKTINFSRFLSDINALANTNQPLAIDLAQLGIVPFTDRVAVIADITVTSLQLDPDYVPNDLSDTPVLTITHGTQSILHYSRQLFGFNHVPSEVPRYTCRYNFDTKQCVMDKPSPLQQSLLYFLVCPPESSTRCPDLDRLVQYVLPAFWTSLYVTYEDDNVEQPPIIQSLTLDITYDGGTTDECYVRVITSGGYESPLLTIQSSDASDKVEAAFGEFIRFYSCFSTISVESEVISAQFAFDQWQIPTTIPAKHPTPSRIEFSLTKSTTLTAVYVSRFNVSTPVRSAHITDTDGSLISVAFPKNSNAANATADQATNSDDQPTSAATDQTPMILGWVGVTVAILAIGIVVCFCRKRVDPKEMPLLMNQHQVV